MYVSPISERLFKGRLTPAIRAICGLALPLLMTLVLADDENRFVTADDPALLAHRLPRRSSLHDPFRLAPATRLWLPGRPPLPRRGVALTRQASAHSSRTADGSNYPGATAACASARCGSRLSAGRGQGVRTRGPPGGTATVNSKCAGSESSWEKIAQPSPATRTDARPAVVIGSIASTMPSSSRGPLPGLP